jgi:hypothetical protein
MSVDTLSYGSNATWCNERNTAVVRTCNDDFWLECRLLTQLNYFQYVSLRPRNINMSEISWISILIPEENVLAFHTIRVLFLQIRLVQNVVLEFYRRFDFSIETSSCPLFVDIPQYNK